MNLNDISTFSDHFFDTQKDSEGIISGKPPLKVIFQSSDNKWEYFFSPEELDSKQVYLVGGMVKLLGEKAPFAFLARDITAREIENFLRTENHQALFEVNRDDDDLLENCLFRWAQHGFSQFLPMKMDNSPLDWPSKLSDQLQLLNGVINHQLNEILEEYALKVHMIALEGETVVVNLGRSKAHLLLPGLLQFLRQKFKRETLNIVAEEESPS